MSTETRRADRIAEIRRAHLKWLREHTDDVTDDTPLVSRGGRLVLDDEPAAYVDLSALASIGGDEPLVSDEVSDVVRGRVRAMEMGRL